MTTEDVCERTEGIQCIWLIHHFFKKKFAAPYLLLRQMNLYSCNLICTMMQGLEIINKKLSQQVGLIYF